VLALLETNQDVFIFAVFAADQTKDSKPFCDAMSWNGAFPAQQGRGTQDMGSAPLRSFLCSAANMKYTLEVWGQTCFLFLLCRGGRIFFRDEENQFIKVIGCLRSYWLIQFLFVSKTPCVT